VGMGLGWGWDETGVVHYFRISLSGKDET